MNSKLQIKPEVNAINNSLEYKYPMFDWSLNLDTREFSYDYNALASLLDLEVPIVTITDFMQYITQEQRKELELVFLQAIKSGERQHFSCCFVPNQSILAYVEFYFELTQPRQIEGTVRPVMLVSSKHQIANVFRSLFENSHHGVLITDSETRIIACNQHYENQMGFEHGTLIGVKTNIFNVGKYSDQFYDDMWHQIHTNGFWSGTLLTRDAHNQVFPQELTIQKIEATPGEIYYLGLTVALPKQTTQIATNELGGLALSSKLPTKDKFLNQLRQLCGKDHQANSKIVLTIKPKFACDCYNDHVELSEVISLGNVSQAIGYLGDQIFVVCIDCQARHESIESRCVRSALRDFFQEIRLNSRKEIYDGVMNGRIGVSILGLDSQSASQLLSHATQAMLERHSGEDRNISFYHSTIHNEIKRKKRLEDGVLQAIQERRLEVHYQPIVDARSGEITKFEALCRFPSIDEESNVQELINIAEDLDLINELDSQVSMIALDRLEDIHQQFGEHVGLTLNCSLNTQREPVSVLNNLAELICTHAKKPECVTIELTESAYFDNEANQSDALKELRNLGVSIAIDDFGTGYSSFSYLSNSQFDILKIDKAFVSDIHLHSNKFNIVKMITELSHTLGVEVVAEGVENYHEFRVLQNLKVDNVQGFLFSKPKPFFEFNSGKPYVDQLKEVGLIMSEQSHDTILGLSRNGPPRIHPSEPLSLAFQYINEQSIPYIPVVIDNRCVGIVGKDSLNLHLTLTMGTDLETTKESQIWRKTINQVMQVKFTQLQDSLNINELAALLDSEVAFPWVFVDSEGEYRGILYESDIIRYFTSC
ncbi:EAL domain-containing protein [Vibrio cortegadensis]|uniref:EAL domain-containing protein n=1 Tax=Vibrio cortegadensis TaxID=1328770 RepID=A0ABV4M5A6_9VIBR